METPEQREVRLSGDCEQKRKEVLIISIESDHELRKSKCYVLTILNYKKELKTLSNFID